MAGVIGLFAFGSLRRFRAMGVAALAAVLFLPILRGKEYYLGPMHPLLLAAGSVLVGSWLASRRRAWWGTMAWGAAGGVLLLPMGIPLLPPAAMARYSEALGMTRAVTTNRGTGLPLPQDYADMLGWREQAAEVARIFHALPEPERTGAVTLGGDYGRAGALGRSCHFSSRTCLGKGYFGCGPPSLLHLPSQPYYRLRGAFSSS